MICLKSGHQVQDLGTDRNVEGGHRLVRHYQLWVEGQGACEGDSLPLTTGELVRKPPDSVGGYAHLA